MAADWDTLANQMNSEAEHSDGCIDFGSWKIEKYTRNDDYAVKITVKAGFGSMMEGPQTTLITEEEWGEADQFVREFMEEE